MSLGFLVCLVKKYLGKQKQRLYIFERVKKLMLVVIENTWIESLVNVVTFLKTEIVNFEIASRFA